MKKLAGSRKNKRHKFVRTFPSDTLAVGNRFRPQHELRFADITDCYPLIKLGHQE